MPYRRFIRPSAVLAVCVTAALIGGCADFSAQDKAESAGTFTSEEFTPGAPVPTNPLPQSPSEGGNGGTGPVGPCPDPDPAVIVTCRDATTAVMPGDDDGESTVVAERTGAIVTARRGIAPRTIATVPVDTSGDGGLVDFARSPTYAQDRLIYAYVSTPSDNRVVRIAPGDTPKPIVIGIPKGATGNVGSLIFRSPSELWIATGNAGDPAAAADPTSLAGKVLSVGQLDSTAASAPRIVASGIGANATFCEDRAAGVVYLTDRAPAADRLQRVDAHGSLSPVWTWPDKPHIAGCATTGGTILVSETATQRVEMLSAPRTGDPTVAPPQKVFDKRYGALGRMGVTPSGVYQIGTVNKQFGKPTATDDRVVRFLPPSASNDKR